MNDESLLELLNAVLQLDIGESRVLREKHLLAATVHRYRDGYTVLLDGASDRQITSRAPLGWHFPRHEDIALWLLGEIDALAPSFVIEGTR